MCHTYQPRPGQDGTNFHPPFNLETNTKPPQRVSHRRLLILRFVQTIE